MTADSEGVHAIANTASTEREADIVFVHGLRGGAYSTWQYGKKGSSNYWLWPEALGNSLPHCGIWTAGYAAGITGLGNPGMIIEKRAGNIASQLTLAGLGDRPLIFITHSMGGLVVKSLIMSSQFTADQNRKDLVEKIQGVVFCGTPHRGSEFAWAAGILFKFFGGSQPHVKEMEDNAETLDLLHDKFLAWQRENPILVESYAESIGLFRKRWFGRPIPLGLVVPRASANPGVGAIHDVDADHLSLVKPAPAVPVIHNLVFRGVERFIDKTLKSSSHREEVSRIENLTEDESQSPNNAAAEQASVQIEFDRRSEFVGGSGRVLTTAFHLNRIRNRTGATVEVRIEHQALIDAEAKLVELARKDSRSNYEEAEYRHLIKLKDFLTDQAIPQLTDAINLAVNNARLRDQTWLGVDDRLHDFLVGLRDSIFCYGTPVFWGESTEPDWLKAWSSRSNEWYMWWRDDDDLITTIRVSDDDAAWFRRKYVCDHHGDPVFPGSSAFDLFALGTDVFYLVALPKVLLTLARKWPAGATIPDAALDLRRWVFSAVSPDMAWVLPSVTTSEFHELRNQIGCVGLGDSDD